MKKMDVEQLKKGYRELLEEKSEREEFQRKLSIILTWVIMFIIGFFLGVVL